MPLLEEILKDKAAHYYSAYTSSTFATVTGDEENQMAKIHGTLNRFCCQVAQLPKQFILIFKKKVIILERRAPECFNYLGLFTSSGYDNDPPLSQ